ncbi:hypothetical protein TUM4249_30080 [Shewanella sp. KT0246]|nr:hypothetical protein [uncultured Shewanella sp.]GIU53367.1 hypothetical protein TUM4249_30080 [Shewanella sp. KT0246]
MIFLIIFVSCISGFYLGNQAFYNGMAVKRWSLAGFLMGPLAYPLFNSHKYLLIRKLSVENEQTNHF